MQRELRAADGELRVEHDGETVRLTWAPIVSPDVTEVRFPARLALRAAGALLAIAASEQATGARRLAQPPPSPTRR